MPCIRLASVLLLIFFNLFLVALEYGLRPEIDSVLINLIAVVIKPSFDKIYQVFHYVAEGLVDRDYRPKISSY